MAISEMAMTFSRLPKPVADALAVDEQVVGDDYHDEEVEEKAGDQRGEERRVFGRKGDERREVARLVGRVEPLDGELRDLLDPL